ncbi:MAG: hypothetical protein DRR08_12400 [Candidatus Parabeggiatoa sp. nov. 2]|nr:MAG: hypothetical protein B6247_04215 [Beggiatoa sp. 4572_84]RKZ60033.1 MAG: hypothetical protein DRR08_12400 [Gammaproteobacteria bacterium]
MRFTQLTLIFLDNQIVPSKQLTNGTCVWAPESRFYRSFYEPAHAPKDSSSGLRAINDFVFCKMKVWPSLR